MKIAAYHKSRGDFVNFMKGGSFNPLFDTPWDRVYVTTLFTFEWKRTAAAIDFALQAVRGQSERVFVGGIAASLMHKEFVCEPRWAGIRFIKGLLDQAPAVSLQLSINDYEFGAEDIFGTPIEELIPDYSILDDVDYKYPVIDAYFGYASRGCVRKCAFCGVPKLEGAQREMPPLSNLINGISETYGVKKDLVLMDNNITASARYREVIAEIRDLGFEQGATLSRNGNRSVKRRVDFNQGIDARILATSPIYLKEMSTICISPLRIAFDHLGLRKVYESSVRMAADHGIVSLSNYMLYNFMDTPRDLYERMKINIALNQELGIRIWSFPMRYQPINLKDRSHVGKNWNRYFLRSFQIMLQATHGVVSGNPSYFEHAFGEDRTEFEWLLSLPHAFIFHRTYYEEHGEGEAVRKEYENLRAKMSEYQTQELMALLAGPLDAKNLQRKHYRKLAGDRKLDPLLRKAMQFHTLDTQDRFNEEQVLSAFSRLNPDPVLPPDDEFIEDAGLFEPESVLDFNPIRHQQL